MDRDDIFLFIQLLAEFSFLQLKGQGLFSLLSAKGHSQLLEAACIPWLMVPFSTKPEVVGQVPLSHKIYYASSIILFLTNLSCLPSLKVHSNALGPLHYFKVYNNSIFKVLFAMKLKQV